MRASEHFAMEEFQCKCGCKGNKIQMPLIEKLEQLHSLMGAKAIFVNSGYRCPVHSVRVGGSAHDAHTVGIAVDIRVQRKNGEFYTGTQIAEAAERIGFTGIGIINSTSCHIDIRNSQNYVNAHWFGDERTGNNSIKTFQKGTVFDGTPVSVQKGSAKIRELQEILNTKGKGLVVDGIAGKKTLEAVKGYSIIKGNRGELVKWVQEVLNCKGFNCGVADGIAGVNTILAINRWQVSRNLGVGKLYGSDWEMLIKEVS